jgi:glutaminyl-peptide cyclotransferase
VAHYDSKISPAGFIGATDSAVPCAVIMHAARSVDEALTQKWAAMKADGSAGNGLDEEKGVQILLLDGEEAFVSWTSTDSLYGARYASSSLCIICLLTFEDRWPKSGNLLCMQRRLLSVQH